MQVVHKGKGEIAMTEGELARFFGVTWRKLNHRLQAIIKSSNLHPDERVQAKKKLSMVESVLVMHHFIRSQQSLPCPFYWTAWKRIYSESTSVEDCRQSLPL